MQSFQGNPALKRSLLQKAQTFQASDGWSTRPIYWDGNGGSLVGGLLGSEDLDQWTCEFMLPKWTALLLDMIAVMAPSSEEAKAAQNALLDALPVGVDLDQYGNVILSKFLKEIEKDLSILPTDHSLRAALAGIMALHEDEISGKVRTSSEWRKARSEAITATDQTVPDSLTAKFGSVIEAAAWNPRMSRSVVADTFRTWINARRDATVQEKVQEQSLMTFDEIKNLLDRIYEEERNKRKDQNSFINVFEILEERYPKEHRNVRNFHRIQHEEAGRHRKEGFQIIISTLKGERVISMCKN